MGVLSILAKNQLQLGNSSKIVFRPRIIRMKVVACYHIAAILPRDKDYAHYHLPHPYKQSIVHLQIANKQALHAAMASFSPVHKVVSLYSVSGWRFKKSFLHEQMLLLHSTSIMINLFFIIMFY